MWRSGYHCTVPWTREQPTEPLRREAALEADTCGQQDACRMPALQPCVLPSTHRWRLSTAGLRLLQPELSGLQSDRRRHCFVPGSMLTDKTSAGHIHRRNVNAMSARTEYELSSADRVTVLSTAAMKSSTHRTLTLTHMCTRVSCTVICTRLDDCVAGHTDSGRKCAAHASLI